MAAAKLTRKKAIGYTLATGLTTTVAFLGGLTIQMASGKDPVLSKQQKGGSGQSRIQTTPPDAAPVTPTQVAPNPPVTTSAS